MNKNEKNGQNSVATSAKKNELFQFVLEDYEGKVGFTDYGTKEQMAALYADAILRMERFSKKCKNRAITLVDSGKENGGEWSKYEWVGYLWNMVYIRFQKVPDFNSSSFKELSKEMNYFYNNY